VFATAVAALGLAAAFAGPAAAAPATVTVAGNAFSPATPTIVAGESVTWNFSEANHNVKGSGWSGNNDFGKGTYTKTFADAGTFTFVCEAHADKMKGSVTVTPAAAATAPTTLPGLVGDLLDTVGGPVPGAAWLFPETEDVDPPRLAGVNVSLPRGTGRPRLSVRLSEDALIIVRSRREGSSKASAATRRKGTKGVNRFALKSNLRPGLYRLRIGAVDDAGNESAVRTTTVRVAKKG